MKKVDVIIVGAGIVGCATAIALAQLGLQVLVLDKNKITEFPQDSSVRVSAINGASKNYLEELGVWSELPSERVSAYQKMFVWDREGKIEYDNAQLTSPLGWIIENNLMQWALQSTFKLYQNITFNSESTIAWVQNFQDDVIVQLEQADRISAKLVIGADGADSWLRKQVNIEITSKSYHHTAIIANIECEKPHQQTAWQHFLTNGPLAFLPLHHAHHCSIVWSVPESQAQTLLHDTDEAFSHKLTNTFEHKLGKVKLLSKRLGYPLTMRHAKEYFAGRVVLLGDALHTIHPLAGLGLNLGLMDSRVLSQILADAIKEKKDLADPHFLARFQRERKLSNSIIIAAMYFFKECFSNDQTILTDIRNAGLNWTNRFAWLKQFFIEQAAKV